MMHTYHLTGMTCNGCVATVKRRLSEIDNISLIDIDLAKGEAIISMKEQVPIHILTAALPEKFTIWEKVGSTGEFGVEANKKSKLQQLKPLLLIFLYLFSATFLLHYKDWNSGEAMLDFMGLFYVVFSFFKFLDLKGFPESFRMYDPLAKIIPLYGRVYPFIEICLGLMFLMRFHVTVALIATLLVLGITTIGVSKVLLDKKSIRCACLGTALQLPMTEATFIENSIMLVMAITMLFQY